MDNIIPMLENFGFPIACVIGMGWFFYKQWVAQREDNKAREERMFAQLDKFGDSLNSFNNTLLSIDKRLETVEKKIEE